ncbi:hypothetical protein DV711_04435 [Motiliproteus coralliicola]|uniref:Uncharacterized protein n=1 Tax=Motiliproteus coralliicola TaxID=2283196 RepID=A0A369WRT4_9GAMM|nr:hypothetical protein [Motiliproteus coralliicola]RDE24838.1 hypothetical protein DV711_04435 [Motiliproteus coralliicola]
MIRASILFLTGALASGGLFQFDLDLPSFHATQYQTQRVKVDRAKATVEQRRANLSKKSLKKAGKKAAGSLIPFVGAVVTLGLAAEDYCEELAGIIELQNILDGEQERFDLDACLKEAESYIQAQFE